MKRTAVLKRITVEAKREGKSFEIAASTNHTGVVVGGFRLTPGRHSEIDDLTARKFFDQFATVQGKEWWR